MRKRKISFDLSLGNKLFKANQRSLLHIAKQNLVLYENEYESFIRKLTEENSIKVSVFPTKDEEASHHANIEWIFLNSILIALYSFFEHHLFALCRVVEDKDPSLVKIDDIKGEGIAKFCKYLSLVGQLKNGNKSGKEWQEVDKFRKVRNSLVHNGGILRTDLTKKLEDHELYPFLKKHKVIMAGSLGLIRIRKTHFLEFFAQNTSAISDKLTAEIVLRYEIK